MSTGGVDLAIYWRLGCDCKVVLRGKRTCKKSPVVGKRENCAVVQLLPPCWNFQPV